ncbi:MAG TPA: ABC transporter permease subunit, partial [Vicinamibacterales bacterium]|nr:ABC transporter permease subunit [Vicinamibacterales bacterium]
MVRIHALLRKEFLDLARNRAALVPVLIMTVVSLAMPFFVLVVLPAMTGRAITADRQLIDVSRIADPAGTLAPSDRVVFFLFQQFLILFLLTPVTGAMSLAAHAVVGEKQTRTLEPLLATPITTIELLVAKVLGSLLPALGISYAGLALYFAGVFAFEPAAVFSTLLSARTLALTLLVGPSASLVSLQSAIVISSRVNDPRTAQQFGVLIVVPLTIVFVGQLMGSLWLSARMLVLVGTGLVVVWVLLVLFSVALF